MKKNFLALVAALCMAFFATSAQAESVFFDDFSDATPGAFINGQTAEDSKLANWNVIQSSDGRGVSVDYVAGYGNVINLQRTTLSTRNANGVDKRLSLAAGTYELSFVMGAYSKTGGEGRFMTNVTQSGGTGAYLVATMKENVVYNTNKKNSFAEYLLTFTLEHDTPGLSFAFQDTAGNSAFYLANVTLSKMPETAPTPIPAAALLFATGVPGLVWVKRRFAQ